jgi:hypothetical protein
MNYVIARVVGNELPPRDEDNSKYRSLIHILESERKEGFDRVWVLNRIHDPAYRRLLIETLAGEKVLEIPFKLKEYFKCPDLHQRILYATNLNAARNFVLGYCRPRYRFTAMLDQDCYYFPEDWPKVQEIIEADQKINDRKYYCSPSIRWHPDMSPEKIMPEEESMIIFRNDADKCFNPELVYGDRTKVELLARIAGESLKAATVCHIAYSDARSELERGRRHQMRQESIGKLIEMLDGLCIKVL